jgi:type I restriction enzyme S subunit
MTESAAVRDLCDVRHGGTPSKAVAEYWDGEIPWISPKDMKTTEIGNSQDRISADAVDNSATSVVPPGTVLIVVRSGILAHTIPIAKTLRSVAFNQDIKALIPNNELIEPDYLFWFLRARASDIVARGVKKGATVHSIRSGFIEGLAVPLRSRERQRHIIDLLARADGVVRLRRQAKEKAVEVIPALFSDMFGDSVGNPRCWPSKSLGEIAEVVSGITKGRKLNGKPTVSVPYLRVANVQAGFLDLTEMKEIEATPAEVQELTLRPGDVVLTEGGDYDKLGRGALWRGQVENCVHQNHVFRVRVNQEIVETEYFESYLQTEAARRYFLSVAKRTTNLASINMTQLRRLPVSVPPLAMQRAFIEKLTQVWSIHEQQVIATAKAQATFNALVADIFAEQFRKAKGPSARDSRGESGDEESSAERRRGCADGAPGALGGRPRSSLLSPPLISD